MMLRSFIAIKIPEEIQSAVARSITPLQKKLPKPLVRWVAPENVHLTLKFLGDVSSANIDILAESLKVEASNHEIFSMAAGSLGVFPNAHRARVIWIGLEGSTSLKMLVRGVETVAERLGYPAEERPFSPHLTIGRVGQNISAMDLQRISTALGEMNVGSLGLVQVDAIHIYKSDLLPTGSVYTELFRLKLKSSMA
jgi:2'-5' RNA ligase